MRTNLSIHLARRGNRATRRAVAIIEPFAKPGTVYAERFGKMKQDFTLRKTTK